MGGRGRRARGRGRRAHAARGAMVAGSVELNVIKTAGSWAEGLQRYQEQKLKPHHEGETPKPHYVTRHFKSREEAAVNPITQKFTDKSIESTLVDMEHASVSRTLNRAYDKQLLREQHFDVITQNPKKGHVHEVPYVQRLKPPSLITANHVGYNILSGKGLHEHHWAAPGKRPERIMTPPRKEPFLTAVNRPREFDILNNRFREHHEERQRWEMDQKRQEIVDRVWEVRDFNPVSCTYYDDEKEQYYQKRVQEMLLAQGSNSIGRLPPTLAASESLMFDICTGVVKDPVRLRQKIEADRIKLENRSSKLGAEERLRVHGEVTDQKAMERKIARISHNRHADIADRGFHIISNSEFDREGHPPPPQTKPRKSLWEFRQTLHADSGPRTADSKRSNTTQSRMGSAGDLAAQGSQSDRASDAGGRRSMAGTRVRSGGFAHA